MATRIIPLENALTGERHRSSHAGRGAAALATRAAYAYMLRSEGANTTLCPVGLTEASEFQFYSHVRESL